tara:strand:+ start:91 stop:333 length:243 start_codon:yes stop_codon:yes gene_type:complete
MKKLIPKYLKEYHKELEAGIKQTYINKVKNPEIKKQMEKEMEGYFVNDKGKFVKKFIKKSKGGSMSKGTAFINSLYKDKM